MKNSQDTAALADVWTPEIERIRNREERFFRLLLAVCLGAAVAILVRLMFG